MTTRVLYMKAQINSDPVEWEATKPSVLSSVGFDSFIFCGIPKNKVGTALDPIFVSLPKMEAAKPTKHTPTIVSKNGVAP